MSCLLFYVQHNFTFTKAEVMPFSIVSSDHKSKMYESEICLHNILCTSTCSVKKIALSFVDDISGESG